MIEPELRFSQFNDDWKEKQLSDIGDCIMGVKYRLKDITSSDGLIVLRANNIRNGKLSLDNTVQIIQNVSNEMYVHDDDILICVRNGSRSLLGKCCKIFLNNGDRPMTFGSFMVIFRSAYNAYIFQVMQTEQYKRQIYRNSGSTINQITMNDLRKITIRIPSVQERIKITKFLELIDDKIALQSNLISSLKTYKKGLLMEIFSSGGDSKRSILNVGTCSTKKFSDVFTTIPTACRIVTSSECLSSGKYPVLNQSKNILKYSNDDTKAFRPKDTGIIAFCDHTREFKYIDFDFTVGVDGIKLIYSKDYNTKYLYYYMQSRSIIDYGYSRHFKCIKHMEYIIPDREQQNTIVDLFTTLDSKIESQVEILNKLKLFKRGLLQKMFI